MKFQNVNIYYILLFLGEACWWTVHPSSKQRSEGEKVRVGDDAILVSVATERYLVGAAFTLCKLHIGFNFRI